MLQLLLVANSLSLALSSFRIATVLKSDSAIVLPRIDSVVIM